MCGLAGIFLTDLNKQPSEVANSIKKMTSLMERRGPDDAGIWQDSDAGLYFGFRRLAILDLTAAGHQPMVSENGRSVIIFNGEIYNFQELRHELEQKGVVFRSRSDTEVLLEALNEWGVAALPKLNGMFAFAWYDKQAKSLLLARDHAGIKPLYYYLPPHRQGIAFGSQYNILLHTPWGHPGEVQSEVLRLYLRLHHIPPPFALLANTYQLEPGHYLQLRPDGSIHKDAWWRLPRDVEPELFGSQAVTALTDVVDKAICRQRIADVPLGVFLSGGVDSPLVTAVARQQTNAELKAFTIGNPGWAQDEAEAAANYGKQLDVDYRIHNVNGKDALDTIQDIIVAQHEPFADFSIMPTLWVSRFARSELTVALSGDGGDELFFGYTRPHSLLRNGADFRWPHLVRFGLHRAGKLGLGKRRSDAIMHANPGDYYLNVNCRVSDGDVALMAPDLASLPVEFDLYKFDQYQGQRHLAGFSRYVEFYGQLQRCLKKVDMASMHHSLEVRVPLLDREIIETSLRIDPLTSMANGRRKAVLRYLLAQHVPPSMIPKPKRGFSVPLTEWLQGPLRPLVEETLLQTDLYPAGVFSRQGVQNYWQQFLAGGNNAKWGIWTLLSLQWWAKHHIP